MSGMAEGRVSIVGELPGRLVGFRNPGNPGTPIRTKGPFKILDAVVEQDGKMTRVSGTVMIDKKSPLFFTGKDLVDIETKLDLDLDSWAGRFKDIMPEPANPLNIFPGLSNISDYLREIIPELKDIDLTALILLDKFARFIAEPTE